jgi:T5SS/PEP-CTERM-associated repeat protein
MWSIAGVLVVGNSGSSNQLVATNGANVTCGLLTIGNNPAAEANMVTITGTNSLLSVSGDVVVGNAGQLNQLRIGDTAGVVCNNGIIGGTGSSNVVFVTDNASWTLSGNLTIGPGGPGNQLILTNGGSVVTAVLDVQRGTLTINGGAGTVAGFIVTNGTQSVFTFGGGYLASGTTQISNTQPAVIGDGMSTATFQLNGGIHTFIDGLHVLSNAAVSGCGTINGNVTIDAGGVVAATCGGTLTFTGIVTNNGDIQVLYGTALESYGTLVNNGIIDLFDAGSTNFHGAFINNGTVRNGANIVISGKDVILKVFPLPGFSYQLQVTPSLKPATWVNTGAEQSSSFFSSHLLTFTDVGGATNRPSRFYRFDIHL